MENLDKKQLKNWLILMQLGSKMGCHQLPERSFFYKGYQFPVCARCTGILIGEFVAIVAILCALKIDLLYAVLFIVPTAIDGGLQYIKIWQSNNLRRLITGLPAGFGLTFVYFNIFSALLHLIK